MIRIVFLILFSFELISFEATAIVGGVSAQKDDLIYRSTVGLSNGCTGTLIRRDILITAAHCLSRPREIEILFGLNFREAQRRKVDSIVVHPDYKGTQNGGLSPDMPASSPIHDIAIIKLESGAPAGFQPVVLGSGQRLERGERLILAGFGQTSSQGGGSGRLRYVATIFNFYNSEAQEIVFGPTPGRSACRGDSGGPMYLFDGNQLILIGVTSRGFPQLGACSGNGNYTEIEAHFNWIQDTVDQL